MTQITTPTNEVEEHLCKHNLAAEHHTGCNSVRIRTGNRGYNSHGLTTEDQEKVGLSDDS